MDRALSLSLPEGGRPSLFRRWAGWLPLSVLAVMFLVALTGHFDGLINYLFPFAALGMGVALYKYSPAHYLSYTWWLWMWAPEARRVVDYHIGYQSKSPVQLAPYLVTLVTVFTALRFLPQFKRRALFPFLLALLGILFSYEVGLARNGFLAASFGLLGWLLPVLFGFHLATDWRRYDLNAAVIRHTFVWGMLSISLYGLFQFFHVPAWDAYWMTHSGMDSIGSPHPFMIRIFGPLNSPAPYATVLMAGLLYVFAEQRRLLRWMASGAGALALALTLVRSAWGGWAVGAAYILYRSRAKVRAKMVIGGLAFGLLLLPVTLVGPIHKVLIHRVHSITHLQHNQSYQARLVFYERFAERAFTDVIGQGLGATGVATKLAARAGRAHLNFDSGIMNIPFVLGWFGGGLYIMSIMSVTLLVTLRGRTQENVDIAVHRALIVGILAQLIFANVLLGVTGIIFWSNVGLLAAYRQKVRFMSADRNAGSGVAS